MDAVLHLAAAKSGDLYAQYAGTVVATENLLGAMDEARVRRIVLVSSFSVYDYMKIRSFAVLDETSPVERDAFERDEYAHTKLVQERLVRDHAVRSGWDYTVLRPGVIYGKDNLWTARLGVRGRARLAANGAWARLPLTYVENCAEAIVMAAETEAASAQTLNVVDDEMPTQRRVRRDAPPADVAAADHRSGRLDRRARLGRAGDAHEQAAARRPGEGPGIFIPCRLAARCKPLRFSNHRIKEVLGWKPRYSLNEALDRSFAAEKAAKAQAAREPARPAPKTLRCVTRVP